MSLTLLEAAAAKLEGKRVEYDSIGGWVEWCGNIWRENHEYRIAPEPKKVKFLAWITAYGALCWYIESVVLPTDCKRVPSEDKEVEVEA